MSGSGHCQIEGNVSGDAERVGGDFMSTCRIAESKTYGFAWMKEDSVSSLFTAGPCPFETCICMWTAQAMRAENPIRGKGTAKPDMCSNAPQTALLGTNPLKSLLTWPSPTRNTTPDSQRHLVGRSATFGTPQGFHVGSACPGRADLHTFREAGPSLLLRNSAEAYHWMKEPQLGWSPERALRDG